MIFHWVLEREQGFSLSRLSMGMGPHSHSSDFIRVFGILVTKSINPKYLKVRFALRFVFVCQVQVM